MNGVVSDLRQAVLDSRRFRVAAGNTKTALSGGAWHLGRLSGVTNYDPQEFTITALAGTPLSELRAALHANRQHLAFDPPLRDAGATIGGTVAAGLSGPGSFRFGGVRDFITGVKLMNGQGEWLAGGGQVVKNAAGFDIPKLMVGSLGEFGVITEVTMKVFPRPESRRTILCQLPDLQAAAMQMNRLARSQLELTALELIAPATLAIQVAGSAVAARERVARTLQALQADAELLDAAAANDLWTAAREFTWVPPGTSLLKIACNPTHLAKLDDVLQRLAGTAPRRYGVGGHVAYVAWPRVANIAGLESELQRLRLGALPLTGDWPASRLGHQPGQAFMERLRQVFDPHSKFTRRTLAEKAVQ